MSGYSSDGVLSISSTSDRTSTENYSQSPFSWSDEEIGQSTGSEDAKIPRYAEE